MKRKTFSSRLLAILMTVALVLSFASVSAFAEDSGITMTGYEKFETINVPDNDQDIPAGQYVGVPVNGNIAIVKQATYAVVFGLSSESEWTDELKSAVEQATGGRSVIKDGVLQGTFYYAGSATFYQLSAHSGEKYYLYTNGNGQKYILAENDQTVSHFITGNDPSIPSPEPDPEPTPDPEPEPEEPGKTNKPGMVKEVSDSNEDWTVESVSAAAGNKVNFKLTTHVPTELGTNYVLTIHDRMDSALQMDLEDLQSIQVKIGDQTLTMGTDYAFDRDPVDGDSFDVVLVLTELYKKNYITDEDLKNGTAITVTYTATLKEGTTAGAYSNTAWVTSPDGESTHPDAEVDTYAISVVKTDQNTGAPLKNAGFTLYAEDGTTEVAKEQMTNEEGKLTFEGLDAGTYVLKETSVPNGYVNVNFSKTITLPDEAGDDYIYEISVVNTQSGSTGGAGTMFYTFGGLAIVAAAGIVLLASRKSRKQSA